MGNNTRSAVQAVLRRTGEPAREPFSEQLHHIRTKGRTLCLHD
jgi:hypothetical protein